MDAKSSKSRSGSPGAGSSGSGSSPKRRSARLSGKVVAPNLQKQVALKNFLGPHIKETPRTLLEGFASKQTGEASLVKSDKTLELSSSRLESPKVLEKSRDKQKSFHEESFLHPIQQKTSLPSGRKRRTAPEDVPIQRSPKKTTNVPAGNRNWRRPKPVDRFNVKRQSRKTIEAAIVGDNSPRDVASHQSPNHVVDQADEEEKELEFTDASISSTAISGIGFSGSGKDGVDKERGDEADVEIQPSESEAQADMETEMLETEAEKTVEYDSSSDVGTAKEGASRRNSSYQRRAASDSRSAFTFFDMLRTREAGEMLSTQQSQSASRKSMMTSSRLSSTVSDHRPSSPVATSPMQMPLLHAQVQRVSTPISELSPQAQSMPKLSVVVQQLPVLVQQSSSPVPRLSMLAPQLSVSSAIPEEFFVKELATTSRAGVDVTSSVEVASTTTAEVAVTSREEAPVTSREEAPVTSREQVPVTSREQAPVTSREQAPVTSVMENAGVEEASLSTSQVEEEETREEASESATPRLPWTPRLPPKAKMVASVRKDRQSAVVDDQPQTRGAVKPRSRAVAVASRGRQQRRTVKTTIPRSLSHSAFHFFAGMKVSKEALEEVDQISEMFWSNVVEDLEVYAKHGNRSIVERSDVEILMKRQRFVTENTSLNSLIEKHLALEDRETLIPIARAGNRLE